MVTIVISGDIAFMTVCPPCTTEPAAAVTNCVRVCAHTNTLHKHSQVIQLCQQRSICTNTDDEITPHCACYCNTQL
eukprot:21398-Heterococcus_DN1.PRE.1